MKKGLRPSFRFAYFDDFGPALRPDEEGIKTHPHPLGCIHGRPALRPDEEGIKTRHTLHGSPSSPSGLET